MPPNRKRSRQPSQQPVPVSDYESDTAAAATTAGLTDNTSQPIIPPPPMRTNEELNLLVLRRWQPNITQILTIAPFAVLYIFSAESQGWEKCEVQGSLFLCSLRREDGRSIGAYKLVILNRKGLENWEFDIRSEEAIQVTDEYVIVQKEDEHGEEQIYGIWIFEEKGGSTRDVVGRAILGCAREVEALAEQVDGYEDANEGEEDIVEGYDRTYAEEYVSQQREENNGKDVGEEVWPRQSTPRLPHHQHHPQHQDQHPHQTFQQQQQQQQHHHHHQTPQMQQQPQGQQIDLANLFAKPTAAQPVQPPQTATNIGGTNFTTTPFAEERLAAASASAIPNHHTTPRFPTHPDADFLRSANSPGAAQMGHREYQQAQQTTQQNTLLDLFKDAQRG